MPDIKQIENSINKKYVDQLDGSFAEAVYVVNTGAASGVDRELVVSTYRCRTAFTGASIGDTITSTQIIDVSGTPSTVSTVWRNQTTAADLASAPLIANLELVGAQALTDAQLRATAVPVSLASVPLPTGAATSDNQTTTNTSLSNIDADIGAPADAAATTDAGTFSVIALIKRGLGNWTTLLARVPSLVSGRVPVDGSGITQPVSAASLPLPTGAAATADVEAVRDRLPSALVGNRLNVETLGIPGTARQAAAGAATTNTVLTTTVSRISIYARTADIRYSIGSSAQTATSSSHFIAAGERLDIDVPATPNIATIRAGATDGVLEITELS
jgi:hypothetical protein